jgi:hypothetical protein
MSKFIDAVAIQLTGRESGSRFNPLITRIDKTEIQWNTLAHYRIETIFGRIGACDHENIDMMRKNFMRELRKAVYGDLEMMLIRLERGFVNQDVTEMKEALDDMNKEIFG